MNETNYYITRSERPFARTNRQTIQQRARLLQEWGYRQPTVAEICCGDCRQQQQVYGDLLQTRTYRGLDLSSGVVAHNQAHGVPCVQGDALDSVVMGQFVDFDVVFFGPPLSVNCDGHTLLPFRQVTPGFAPFVRLLLGELQYDGLLVCICPRHTHMGDIRWLHHQVQAARGGVGLRLIHHSYADRTGYDEKTEMRLKYVELWLGAGLDDAWEVRESRG